MATMEFEEPPIVPELFCAFYTWVNEAELRKWEHVFSRINSLGQHIWGQVGCAYTRAYYHFYHFMSIFVFQLVAARLLIT